MMAGWVKQGVSIAAGSAAFSAFVRLLENVGDRSVHLLRVLTYHRIDEPQAKPDLDPALISATPSQFARQLEFLADRYRVVSLAEVLDAVDGRGQLPSRAVLLTFDDGYVDFQDHAWPLLQKYGLAATLFVPTGFPDQPDRTFWWDRLYQAVTRTAEVAIETPLGRLPTGDFVQRVTATRRLGRYIKSLPHAPAMKLVDQLCDDLAAPGSNHEVLGWSRLRRLASQGLTLAPHTRNHPLLNRVSLDEAQAEAVGSLNDLCREVGPVPAVLAYPAGKFTPGVARMLAEQGFRLGFTVSRGINDLRTCDPFRLRRINIGRHTPQAAIRAQLLPLSIHCNRLWPVGGTA